MWCIYRQWGYGETYRRELVAVVGDEATVLVLLPQSWARLDYYWEADP